MRRLLLRATMLVCLGAVLLGNPAHAQSETMRIATIERKPFAFQEGDKWVGFSIELWEKVAANLNLQSEYVGYETFAEMLGSIQAGSTDLAAANISATSAREQVMDFSRPIFDSGLLLLTSVDSSPSALSAFSDPQLWSWVASAIILLLAAGFLISLVEHGHQHFVGRSRNDRMREGFWWAVSVVTNASFTIFTPVTKLGRLLSYLLILVGLFLVSSFVAQITSTMTVQELRSQVNSFNDLRGKSVGTTDASTSARFLAEQSIKHTTFVSIDEMFAALEDGKLDVVVHDAPILAYYANSQEDARFQTVGRVFNPEKYAFALPQGSVRTEQINQQLLALRESGDYAQLIGKWFGGDYQ